MRRQRFEERFIGACREGSLVEESHLFNVLCYILEGRKLNSYSRRNWYVISNGGGGFSFFLFFSLEFHPPIPEKGYIYCCFLLSFDFLVNLLQEAFPVSSGSN